MYGIRNAFLSRPISYLAGHSESVVLHSPQGLWHTWKKAAVLYDASLKLTPLFRMGSSAVWVVTLVTSTSWGFFIRGAIARCRRAFPALGHMVPSLFSRPRNGQKFYSTVFRAPSFVPSVLCARRNKGKIPALTVSYLYLRALRTIFCCRSPTFYLGKSSESRNYSIARIILNPYTRTCIPASIKVLQ